jgi:hypothetical protein
MDRMTLHVNAVNWQQWCAVSAALGMGVYGIRRIVQAIIDLTKSINSLVTEVRVLWGEHEMLTADLALRRNISRHNLREMAYALAGLGSRKVNGKGNGGRSNGKSKGTSA